jgi:hypothetical protein
VGEQSTYVELTSSGLTYNSGTGAFQFNVTVENLIPQPLATTNGEDPEAEGVRVIFHQAPVATSGVGAITIDNEDGTDTFTGSNQAYFEYSGAQLGADGILDTDETSAAKGWTLTVPNTVLTFEFEVYVVADVPFPDGWVDVTPSADSVVVGGATALAATVRSVVGAVVAGASVTWDSTDDAIATIDGDGDVIAVSPGAATMTATAGSRSGSATIAVCPNLALGGVYVAEMPAGADICLSGGGGGAEFTVVPINLSEVGSLDLSLTGSGIVAVSGAPSPARLPGVRPSFSVGGAPQPSGSFEWELRERERRELGPLPRPASLRNRFGAPRFDIDPGVPTIGALMDLNVSSDACTNPDLRTGEVVAIGTNIIIIADTMNPVNGPTTADYEAIADTFDLLVYPTIQGNFGEFEDIDGNDRVIAFYTRAVNELTPEGSSSFVGGFFFSRDLFQAQFCATSNVGEMFYMLAADPTGEVNNNPRSVAFIKSITMGTLAHEFQHMINASIRLWFNDAPFEEVWLDEGLAHIAEELVFYQATGESPRNNIGIVELTSVQLITDYFSQFGIANFDRFREWLIAPHAAGLFEADDELATRGAAWAFLRYAADRRGGTDSDFWSGLLDTQEVGLDNLAAELATDPLPWMRDFATANYGDDAGIGAAATHSHPSWNFREIYENLDYDPGPSCSCAYELDARDPSNGIADDVTLVEGGAAGYFRVGVSSGAFAGITLRSAGAVPPGTLKVAVIRRE